MSNLGQSKITKSSKVALLVVLFALLAVTSAAANSVSYNISANFGSQQLQGTLTWNTATNWVTAFSYSLSGAVGTATCSSSFLCGSLTGSIGSQFVTMLTPFSLGGSNYIYLTNSRGITGSSVSMPEEGFIGDVGILLFALPFLIRRKHFA
jgi:hypothetical protein